MRKSIVFVLILLAAAFFGYFYLFPKDPAPSWQPPQEEPTAEIPDIEVLASDLSIPWDVAFTPEGILITERSGRVMLLTDDGALLEIADREVSDRGEAGLLGILLHPEFAENRYVYLYKTTPSASGGLENRVVRYTFDGAALTEDRIIIEGIPGALYHDGGRMEFGPDGMLYITTGDATSAALAQDINSLAGKTLRLHDDGSFPSDNPFASRGGDAAAVYSYGHRNSQGIAWDSAGRQWQTEHGRSGVTSGLDEINLIQAGGNYGWPESEGDTVRSGTVAPALHSGPEKTWAPASAAILGNSLFFGGLRGRALYEAVIVGEDVGEVREHFLGQFGRIRTVRVGPDNLLYITTSNRDGRGTPADDDDKLIRVNPDALR